MLLYNMPNTLGIVYKLEHKTRTDTPVYIGSTTQTIEERFAHHGYSCNNIKHSKYNYYVYQFIRDYGGMQKWKITKLNECIFNERKELCSLERMFMEKYEKEGFKLLNSSIPTRTRQEWRDDNKDRINRILVQSRLRHREKANEYRRLHYHKNKERIIQQNKEYYKKNKEKIEKQRTNKLKCLCGCAIQVKQRKRHLKSKVHLENLKKVFENEVINI